MLLTTRLILLQVYQKLDRTAISCSKRDFSKTKWKAERRHSVPDTDASIFTPLKEQNDTQVMQRAAHQISKEQVCSSMGREQMCGPQIWQMNCLEGL